MPPSIGIGSNPKVGQEYVVPIGIQLRIAELKKMTKRVSI
jgi:hypothetical protein